MPVKPAPYKLVCPKCGLSKIIAPQSDCLSPKDMMDMLPVCSKCKEKMDRKELNTLDTIFSMFT